MDQRGHSLQPENHYPGPGVSSWLEEDRPLPDVAYRGAKSLEMLVTVVWQLLRGSAMSAQWQRKEEAFYRAGY